MTDEPLRLQLVTGPKGEPVTIGEAKAHCRIDEDADNDLVAGLIKTARELAEDYTRRAVMQQTWKMFLDYWPACGYIEMPKAPLVSVTHIKTYDDADAATTFDSVYYFVDAVTKPGRITIRTTGNWPSPTRVANGIEIQFVCGYETDPANVPQKIKQAMLMMIAEMYEFRNQTVTGTIVQEISTTAQTLLDGERTWLV